MQEAITAYRKQIETALEKLSSLPAHKLDSDTALLKKAFDTAYDEGLFRLFEYGPTLQEKLKQQLFFTLPPYSGSLAFLAVQILAGNKIMGNNDFSQKEIYFEKKCGIAINHLRAPFTVVDATRTDTGYALNGTLTWASGYGIFDHLVVGFHHKGMEMEAIVPFKEQPGMTIAEAAETFVGNSMNTVNVDLEGYELPETDVISSKPIGNYTKAKSVSKTVHYAMYGIGLGAIDSLEDRELKMAASERLEAIKDTFMQTSDGIVMDRLRIDLFTLVQEIITTGMIVKGGSSILADRALQRYYRELIMFNSNGLNDTIKGLFKEHFLKG